MRIVLGFTLWAMAALSQAAVDCDGTTYEINQCLVQAVKKADAELVSKHHLKAAKVTEFKQQRKTLCTWMAKDITGTYSGVYYGHCELSLTQWYVENIGP